MVNMLNVPIVTLQLTSHRLHLCHYRRSRNKKREKTEIRNAENTIIIDVKQTCAMPPSWSDHDYTMGTLPPTIDTTDDGQYFLPIKQRPHNRRI